MSSISYSLNNIPPPFGSDVSGWTGANFVPAGSGDWTVYEWIVIIGGIVGFMMAWSIGANDVANSFGTTVGARTITLWQACIIAAIFEFAGAVALGGEVARTIAGSITSPRNFDSTPEVYMFGMLCALVVATTIITLATYLEFAVSTTHSIVGCVMGFALAYGGTEAVVWNDRKDEFPFVTGVAPIIISWVASPVLSGLLAALLFILCRTFVLRASNAVTRAFIALPILVAVAVYINVFFVLYKGASKELAWDDAKAGWVAALVTAGCALVTIPVAFWLRRRHMAAMESQESGQLPPSAESETDAKVTVGTSSPADVEKQAKEEPTTWMGKLKARALYSLTVDVHEDVHTDATVAAMHANAEVFSPAAENVFKYLQVFSACCVAFSHGANDVANAVGPFAGIFFVYQNRRMSSNAPTPTWILVLGASGIVVGLGTYGYNIIKVLGVKMATMTPSRGFCAELGTALTISIASVYGMPISTTQCIVGAEMGVGLSEDLRRGGNWKLFGKTFAAWVITFISNAILTAGFFAFCAYAPSIHNLNTVREYENAMTNAMGVQIVMLNNTNNANNVTLGPDFYDRGLASNISGINRNLTQLRSYRANGAPLPDNYMALLKNTTWLYMAQSVPSVGFNASGRTNTSAGIVVPPKALLPAGRR